MNILINVHTGNKRLNRRMTSKALQEGILDVKIPRGSENRKLWKAWCRQWIGFSVVYPSGRREPYLTLELSRSPTDIPGSPIRISRDGLRLFRCRSKSRPYRTWAMMSGSKPLLFFAAETEVRAQEWMQSVRDGLWPPCFAFQMLTACSHEVSLIDDDKTFRSGLLGVYGRMILTSEDVISLMHPHWGATLLQVPLGSVQDVRLVRYAEIPPAGVFCIEIKETENSIARNFTFYSSTATDAIQWILSKKFTKAAEEENKFSRNMTGSDTYNQNSEDLNPPILNLPYTIGGNSTDILIDIIDTESEYKIPIPLSKISIPSGDLPQECASLNSPINNQDGVKVAAKQTLITQSNEILADEDIVMNKQLVFNSGVLNSCPSKDISKNISYEKVIASTVIPETTTHKIQDPFHNFNSNEYANVNDLNKDYVHKTNVSFLKSPNNAFESPEYAMNKRQISKEAGQTELTEKYQQTETLKNKLSICDKNLKSKTPISLDIPALNSKYLPTFECGKTNLSELNFICGKITTSPILDDDTGKDQINTEISNIEIENPSLVAPDTWDFGTYAKVNKQYMSENFSNHTLNSKSYTKESSSIKNSEINHSFHLPNISSDLLDTSINSKMLKSKNESSSFENDIEFLPSISDECNDLEFVNNIYEHLLERKGTVYEEIDESDDEFELQLPPELPQRPTKLEIPVSLRLQKLSASINETLKVMKTPPSQSAQYSRPNFVKKIKEIGRIMHVGPSQEIATNEPNLIKTLQADNKNMGILKPSVKNVEIQAETISKPCSTDTSFSLV